jgi:hypothetical protein
MSLTATRQKFWWRTLLAGPAVWLTSLATLCGGALWIPEGAAAINHLALPLVLFPAILAALFFHACLDRSLARVCAVQGTLLFINALLILRASWSG